MRPRRERLTPPLRSGDLLPPRQLAAAWFLMTLIALLAWVLVIAQADGMGTDGDMGMGMGAGAGTMGMSLSLFLLLWVAMMAAMMFPSVAPVAVTWARAIGRQASGAARLLRTTLFVTGYLLAWAVFGLLVYGLLVLFGDLVQGHPQAARWIGTGAFLAAAVQQFSPLKNICLRHCRSPMSQLVRYAGFRTRARDLRVGIHHGLYCVGCCWGLMIVLIPLGSMNIAAMAAVSVIIFVEKLWRLGPLFASVVGVVFLVLAVLTALGLLQDVLLPGLRGA
ncbi:DUF2182 domain-containing protein [Streptomyces sp. KLOTTS4A1]|uniref:DUF2182 domain-containing protein n=1 Tax=Streptomyces sp. KLOTTS4A1 TaxID=3390996 RepID=UPI0039F47B68